MVQKLLVAFLLTVTFCLPVSADAKKWSMVSNDSFNRSDTMPDSISGPTNYKAPSVGAPYMVTGHSWAIVHGHIVGTSVDPDLGSAQVLRPASERMLNGRSQITFTLETDRGPAYCVTARYASKSRWSYEGYYYQNGAGKGEFAVAIFTSKGQIILAQNTSLSLRRGALYTVSLCTLGRNPTTLTAEIAHANSPNSPIAFLRATDSTQDLQKPGQWGITGTHTLVINHLIIERQARSVSAAVPELTPEAENNTSAGGVLLVDYIGDSITAGAGLASGGGVTSTTAPYWCDYYLTGLNGLQEVFGTNQGHSGTTTTDWLPGSDPNSLFVQAEAAAMRLKSDHSDGHLIFSIMLGTNDSASSGPRGAPASNEVYKSNMEAIIGRLLHDFPASKVVVHDAPYYTPNTYNSSDYQQAGLERLVGYRSATQNIVESLTASHPSQVFIGDTTAYKFFQARHASEMQPENGPVGTFYLHPNATGAEDLGLLWAIAISNVLLSSADGKSN